MRVHDILKVPAASQLTNHAHNTSNHNCVLTNIKKMCRINGIIASELLVAFEIERTQ